MLCCWLAWLQMLRHEEGQDLAEYGLLVALIALVALAAVEAFGTGIQGLYQHILDIWATIP